MFSLSVTTFVDSPPSGRLRFEQTAQPTSMFEAYASLEVSAEPAWISVM